MKWFLSTIKINCIFCSLWVKYTFEKNSLICESSVLNHCYMTHGYGNDGEQDAPGAATGT